MNQAHQISYLRVDELQPNPLQPRGVIKPDELVDLVESVREHGILEPVVVAHTPAGFQIIAGERRWRAAKLAGLETVPAIIKETSPQGMLEMALVENVQRTDLNPLERAKAFQRLEDEFHLVPIDISVRVGKSSSYVCNTLRLLELPDAIKDGLLTGIITEGHARALSGIKDTRMMIEGYKMVLKEGGSVRYAEEVARRLKKKADPDNLSRASSLLTLIIHKDIDQMQADIQEALGKRANVRLVRSHRQTKLNILLNGNAPQTQESLEKMYKGIVGHDFVASKDEG
jgi:ParB family chromosome partitioning protein